MLLSLEPGFHFGSSAADVLVEMAGTHGSLRGSSSLGFFMATGVETPPILRAREVASYLP